MYNRRAQPSKQQITPPEHKLRHACRCPNETRCRYGDTWYLYWAGRYATSSSRLGPYVFRADIGKEIPHFPDGRCFIDHGSFPEWHGQWFYAVTEGSKSWSFRQSKIMYLHVCDDGTLMLDETIRRCGVGPYCAQWEAIEAEWFMHKDAGLTKIELRNGDEHIGFALHQAEGENCAHYPHVYDMQADSSITLRARGSGSIEILQNGETAGTAQVASDDFTCITLPLHNAEGECDLTLRFTGCVTLDKFRLH